MFAVLFSIISVAFLGAWFMTGWARKYALTRGILDVPNERSSHTRVTPRGGGIAIAAVVLLGLLGLGLFAVIPWRTALVLIVGGTSVSLIGWVDDRRGVSAGTRLAVHLGAAAWTVITIGGISGFEFGLAKLHLGVFGSVVATLAITWGINAFNFMDGIDGLAASEAGVVGLTAGTILFVMGQYPLAAVSFLIAGAAFGFLPWNWSPAMIFMGDVSSGLLGYLFASLAILSERTLAMPAMIWALLLLPFWVDATGTLLRRIVDGERWYSAHRSHAYQVAVITGYRHSQVTLTFIGINVLLGALAVLVVARSVWLIHVFAVATVAVIGLWYRFAVAEYRKITSQGKSA